MLSRKVIATDITNLTDARYFAARGVDYLLFDMGKISLEQALEIKEWVEGPELLLLFDQNSIPLLDETIIKLNPAGISGKGRKDLAEMSHLSAHAEIFSWHQDQIILEHQMFRQVNHLDQLLSLEPNLGIIISGSIEEEVGLKAFDDLDLILDALESE